MTEITKAEKRARVLAEILEKAGWRVKVRVTHHEAIHYSDGGVMIAAHVFASVVAVGPQGIYDDTYSFTYVSYDASERQRARTKYVAGHVRPAISAKGRRSGRKLSQRELRTKIGSEAAMARYRAERESQEA